MSRFARPSFRFADLDVLPSGRKNRRLFDWWCDDEGEDRQQLLRELRSRSPYEFPSCAPVQNDPAPPLNEPARQGHAKAYLVIDPDHVRTVLKDSVSYSNIPYAGLGGASFMLAMDPVAQGTDWHHEQREALKAALSSYGQAGLRQLGVLAADQAAHTSLRSADFDLALFAEQASLRFFGQLFGFGFQDYALLQDAARAAYRALQYLAFGQHFVSEPGTLVSAQTALAKLASRAASLMEEYEYRSRSPRRYGMKGAETWPEGVQPWSEVGLEIGLGKPLLARIACVRTPLSHRDLATIVACSIAGTLGNVQTGVCSLMAEALRDEAFRNELQGAGENDTTYERLLGGRLCWFPPVSVIPRRTGRSEVKLGETDIPPGTDLLLLLETPPNALAPDTAGACPHVWGDVSTGSAAHACLGRVPASVLMAQIVKRTLRLPGLKRSLDPLTGEVLTMRRLWGIACTQFPLRFDRERERAQQNLIVAMRVKPPISENAAQMPGSENRSPRAISASCALRSASALLCEPV